MALRITPAYAGKSRRLESCAQYLEDHPRVCGEKLLKGAYDDGVQGSPPRMRGKERGSAAGGCAGGITPAYAGKRILLGVVERNFEGSPPRMRGKAGSDACPDPCGRITPAYAGKRKPCLLMVWQFQDHPRVCGEKLLQRPVQAFPVGSPPRMRGKARRHHPGC